ncbi:MAG: hypothetical protein LBH88_04160 [Candidatus Methanoplasma sp.]|jgi:hypothetical protein|nr:hypothetical protein [Candidatus Methanoplasma sp.]
MSEKNKRYTDPDLEKFFRENREMIDRLFKEEKERMEKLFKEEKESFKNAFDEQRARAEEFAEKKKAKAKETAQEAFNAFTDPEVQRHFMAMGMEFMMAMNALMRAMPFPDTFKDMADKAEEARKKASDAARSGKPTAEKVEIRSAPKKPASPKTNTAKTKTQDKDGS